MLYNTRQMSPEDFNPSPPMIRATINMDEDEIYKRNRKRLRTPNRFALCPSISPSSTLPSGCASNRVRYSCWKNHVLTDSAPGSLQKITVSQLPNKGRTVCLSSQCQTGKSTSRQRVHDEAREPTIERREDPEKKDDDMLVSGKFNSNQTLSKDDTLKVIKVMAVKGCINTDIKTFCLWGDLRRSGTEIHMSLPSISELALERKVYELTELRRKEPHNVNYQKINSEMRKSFPHLF